MTRAVTLSLVIACSLAACTQAGTEPHPAPPIDVPDEVVLGAVQRFIAPTPAMRAAALAGDPIRMREAAATLNSCQGPSSCPPEFGACTNWSAGSECGMTCSWSAICRCWNGPQLNDRGAETNARWCEPGDTEDAFRGIFEQYRVCFTAEQDACTEWQQYTTFQGCNC